MAMPLMGFGFPFRVQEGGIRRAHDFAKVEANVRHLLGTRLGERVMLRAYGGGVHHRLHEPNEAILHALVYREIEEGLATYLPEVRLVGPIQVGGTAETLRIAFEYTADPRDVVRRLELELP